MEHLGRIALACAVLASSATGQTPARANPAAPEVAPPAARFAAEPTSGPLPLTVAFEDRSTFGRVTQWAWDFGDGGTSTSPNPLHTYTTPGRYTVRLTVSGPTGSGTRTESDFVRAYVGETEPGLLPGFHDELVFETFTQTAGFEVLGEDDFVVWTKAGQVWRWRAGDFLAQPLVDLREEVGDWSDHGLHGFAFDPDYAANGFVYLYYVVDRHHLDHFGTPSYDPGSDDFERATIARLTRYTVHDPSDPGTTVDPATRTVLVGEDALSGIPICGPSHGIGSLFFGADGSLLITVGDSYIDATELFCVAEGFLRPKEDVQAARAQLVDSPSGKVHRIDPATGDGLSSNPFYDAANPRSWASRVWALGLRQPFRVTLRPEHGHAAPVDDHPGTIYVGEVGHLGWEEISVVTHGGQNFGWPMYEGFEPLSFWEQHQNLDAPNPLFGSGGCGQDFFRFSDLIVEDSLNAPFWPNPCDPAQAIPAAIPRFAHTRPVVVWGHGDIFPEGAAFVKDYDLGGNAIVWSLDDPMSPVQGAAFTGNASIGGAWYTGVTFPQPFQNVYFNADWGEGWIKAFAFDHEDELVAVHDFAEDRGPLMHLEADETSLYYLQYYGPASIRRIQFGANAPPTAALAAFPPYGEPPLLVQLAADDSSDPEGAPLAYAWDFGDGEPWSPLHARRNTGHVYGSEDVTALAQPIAPLFVDTRPRLRYARPLQEPPRAGPDFPAAHDGVYAPEGSEDEAAQVLVDDQRGWFGQLLPAERDVVALIFQEGLNAGPAGGFFGELGVEWWNAASERWVSVSNLAVNPPYSTSSSLSYETFHLSFDPVRTAAVRLRDTRRAEGPRRLTVGELRVFATRAPLPSGPVNRTASVTVTDPFGEESTAQLSISLNNTPPRVTIHSPLDGETYPVGVPTTVPLLATVEDDEHALGALECEWSVILVHDNHIHPEPPDPSCASSFTLLPHGELEGDVVYWLVQLTVTDPLGLATTVTHAMYPEGDCNLNGVLDSEDIADGTSADANGNGLPDECE